MTLKHYLILFFCLLLGFFLKPLLLISFKTFEINDPQDETKLEVSDSSSALLNEENTLKGNEPTISKRDWNSNTYQVSQITKKTEFHQKWVNWLDSDGFKPIDTFFATSSSGVGFEMINAPFKVYLPLTSVGTATFHNDNRYNNLTKKEILDSPLDMEMTALGVNEVSGKLMRGDLITENGLVENTSYVIYPNAYPSGADLIYYVHFGIAPRLQKLVRFDSAAEYFSPVNFRIKYSQDPQFYRLVNNKITRWSKSGTLSVIDRELQVKISDDRGIGLRNFKIWDSNTERDVNHKILQKNLSIQVNISSTGNPSEYTLSKILPSSFFSGSVVYPLYTDTTSTFYPDPNPETTTVDGQVWQEQGGGSGVVWATLQAAAGNNANDTDASAQLNGILSDTNTDKWRRIIRTIILWDTSSIPDTDTVDSATASVFGSSKTDPLSITPNINIYASTPASNTSLANGDYTQTGSTAFSTTIAYADWSTVAYNDFALNASGLANISKTGVSKFALRNVQYDVDNSAPTWSSDAQSYVAGYMADQADTTNDPKLVVVHTSAAAAAAKRKPIFIY